MTYEEKVRWLRRYQDSLRRERELAEELEQLRARAYKVTSALTGMPNSPSDGQSLPRAVEQILEAQRELQAQIEQCNIIRREVLEVIEQISHSRDKELLRRRYLLGQNFEQISVEMHIDYRWARRIHKRNLMQLKA